MHWVYRTSYSERGGEGWVIHTARAKPDKHRMCRGNCAEPHWLKQKAQEAERSPRGRWLELTAVG